MGWLLLLVAAVFGVACRPATDLAVPQSIDSEVAMRSLQLHGPAKFSQVGPDLYRGGQPTEEDLRSLYVLGVRTIVDLRRERLGVRRAERAMARSLGLRFIEFPMTAVLGTEPDGLWPVLELMRASDGAVYVHGRDGGDRTSLLVALYLVAYQGWDPDRAWADAVADFGRRPGRVPREVKLTYREAVAAMRAGSLASSTARKKPPTPLPGVPDPFPAAETIADPSPRGARLFPSLAP